MTVLACGCVYGRAQAPEQVLSCELTEVLSGGQPFTPKPFVPEVTKPPRMAENLKYVPGKDVLAYAELKSALLAAPDSCMLWTTVQLRFLDSRVQVTAVPQSGCLLLAA